GHGRSADRPLSGLQPAYGGGAMRTDVSRMRPFIRPILYALLLLMALIYLIPVWLLLITSLKPFVEVDLKHMWDLPSRLAFENITEAFNKLAPPLRNSMLLSIPAALISSMVGSINGYVFSKWKFPGADLIFTLI